MNIILTCDTRYGPVCLPFDFSMTLSDSWDTPPSNPNNRRSSVIYCGCLKVYRHVAKSLLILALYDLGKKRLRHRLTLYQSLEVPLKCIGIVKR